MSSCGAAVVLNGEELRCILEAEHEGFHSAGDVGRPGVSWAPSRSSGPELGGELVVTRGRAHRFPEKRITRKVCVASRPYRCVSLAPAPAHVPEIPTGAKYLRVMLQPERRGSAGWRVRPLCVACAIAYGLASTDPQGG